MKRLILLCSLSLAAFGASANQIASNFSGTPFYTNLTDITSYGENRYFTVTGNPHGTTTEGVTLTYDFLVPIRNIEFGFSVTGATIIAGTATALNYTEPSDFIVPDNKIYYFHAGAEDGNLRQVKLILRNPSNNITSDDFLNIISIRAVAQDGGYVPEPSTIALFAITMAGMFGFKRRKN